MNHNKKRNTAFLFESLVKELTKAALKNDADRKTQITSIIKEFFYKSGVLKTELGLYKEIYETTNIPKKMAEENIRLWIQKKYLMNKQGLLIKLIR